MLDLTYPAILDLFQEHLSPQRSESASFLIWYLQNYYRLDEVDAVDSVCDQRGDKGVDGIFVNDSENNITVFQAKINQSPVSTIGDSSLREFAGTLTQFQDSTCLSHVQASAKNVMLGRLIKSLDLISKIDSYELRAVFLSNVEIDQNGIDFLKIPSKITFIGSSQLKATYISDKRDSVIHSPITFDIGGFTVTQYSADATANATIAPIKATELVKLEGIADQSLFEYNVRGPLGKTGVNKAITESIADKSLHKLFPFFHNGITLICENLSVTEETLTVSDYFVVNGCQSITSLYNNATKLTEDLRILTKFIKMDPKSPRAVMVTRFSNNQNGVTDRDFMANNNIQIRIQNEFRRDYSGVYAFEIKRGEKLEAGATTISNEDSGLYLLAFDIKEPWATHRKYQVFESRYSELFGRPEATADRIVLCQVIKEAIDGCLGGLDNPLMAKYRLTRYLLMYMVRGILEFDEVGKTLLEKPEGFVRQTENRWQFEAVIRDLLKEIVIDVNHEVKGLGTDFDYRNRLRDSEWVRKLSGQILKDYQKQVARNRIRSFGVEWTERPDIKVFQRK